VPPIFLHMALARDIGTQVKLPQAVAQEEGAYLLGATTPDIRVLTRGDRRDTHFFDLGVVEHQDTVAAFFAAQCSLADAGALDEQTIAWVCGYLTHLVLDERYIEGVYRRYFGQLSQLGGAEEADLMDRMLQYELDRRRRADRAEVAGIVGALDRCSLHLDVGFLDGETLRRWQQVAIDLSAHPPDWERFRFQGGRHVNRAWADDAEAYQEFLQRVPELLQKTIDHVTTAEVDGYLDSARQAAGAAIERYLGGS
jgi:hypothetical protein